MDTPSPGFLQRRNCRPGFGFAVIDPVPTSARCAAYGSPRALAGGCGASRGAIHAAPHGVPTVNMRRGSYLRGSTASLCTSLPDGGDRAPTSGSCSLAGLLTARTAPCGCFGASFPPKLRGESGGAGWKRAEMPAAAEGLAGRRDHSPSQQHCLRVATSPHPNRPRSYRGFFVLSTWSVTRAGSWLY